MDAINNLGKNITIIVIAHRLNTIKMCDKNFILEKGKLKKEATFEELIKSTPTNEIKTYLIITKLKLEKLMEAMTLFKSLCEKENENIIKFIEQNDYKNALNLTLFLKSIPLELTKKESKSDDLIELAKTYNYSELTLALAKIIKN